MTLKNMLRPYLNAVTPAKAGISLFNRDVQDSQDFDSLAIKAIMAIHLH